jgi:hypothetical protein
MDGSQGIESSRHWVIGSLKDEIGDSKLELRSLARTAHF